jgi:hypothetical protein
MALLNPNEKFFDIDEHPEILQKYLKIKNSIKEGPLVYWYDDKGELLLKGKSKNETKKQIKKLNYDGFLFRLNITFHTGKKGGQGGPIAVRVKLFEKKGNKLTHKYKGDYTYMNGRVWFLLKFILTSKWRERYIDIIILKLLEGKLKFKGGIVHYTKL